MLRPASFERRVDPHVGRVFDGLVDGEQRGDLDDAADAGDADDREHEPDGLAFQPVVQSEHAASLPRLKRRRAREHGIRALRDPFRRLSAAQSGSSSRCCSSRRSHRSGTAGRRSARAM